MNYELLGINHQHGLVLNLLYLTIIKTVSQLSFEFSVSIVVKIYCYSLVYYVRSNNLNTLNEFKLIKIYQLD